jgi:hypothetical protein
VPVAPFRAGGGLAARFLGRTVSEAAAFAAGVALGPVLAPPVQALKNEVQAAHPFVPLNPQQAASAEIIGSFDAADVRKEAAYTGLNATRANALRALAGTAPGVNYLFDLRNRGLIADAELDKGLRQHGIRPEWLADTKRLRLVLLTPEQAAAAVERGELTYAEAQAIASQQGVDADAFKVLERLAGLAPAPEQLLDMFRRGAIDAARLRRGLVQGNVRSEWSDALVKLAEHLLSTGELANMVVQGILTQAEAEPLAEITGTSADNFGRLVQLAGSPIGGHDALNLWLRGEITEADVDRALRQSHLKPEWVAAFKALRKHLPSASDAIRFAVKDVFDRATVDEFGLDQDFPDAFLPLAAQLGIEPEQAKWYWAAHWRNVSPTQLYRMLWRGEITPAQLDKGLKVADYSPFWRDKLRNIAYLVPGRIDLRRFYSAGIIDEQQVFDGYKHLGYTDEVARWQTDFAKRGTASTTKDLTVAQLNSEYQGGHLERDDYLARVAALGYSQLEAQQLADLADDKRVARARDQFTARIHTQYVGHKIDLATATAALDDAKIAPRACDLMLAEWQNEREVNVARLTPPQLKGLYKKSVLPEDRVLAELQDRGYSADEAGLFLKA